MAPPEPSPQAPPEPSPQAPPEPPHKAPRRAAVPDDAAGADSDGGMPAGAARRGRSGGGAASGGRTANGSTAADVRRYIERRPVVRDALALGIVNLAALTRRIVEERGGGADAVEAACRRYQSRLQDHQARQREQVQDILHQSRLEVHTRVAVLTLRASWRLHAGLEGAMRRVRDAAGPAHVIHGSEALTVILDDAHADEVASVVGADAVLRRRGGLAQLNVRAPDRVADVEGLLAYLAGGLAAAGVNCIEVIACHHDNMFLVDGRDVRPAMAALEDLMA